MCTGVGKMKYSDYMRGKCGSWNNFPNLHSLNQPTMGTINLKVFGSSPINIMHDIYSFAMNLYEIL